MSEAVQENVWVLGNRLMNELDARDEDDARIVQRGLLLFRQQLVYQLRMEDDHISGYVQDVVPVRVTLDYTNQKNSHCSCPSDGICRHQMAVFFAAYSKEHSVIEWMDLWKQSEPAAVEPSEKLHSIPMTKLPLDYEAWKTFVEETFAEIPISTRAMDYFRVETTFQAVTRKVRSLTPTEQEWKHLYQLITSFFIFEKFLRLMNDSAYGEITHRTLPIFHILMKEMEDAVERLLYHPFPFSYDPFFESLRKDARELMFFEDGYRNERLSLYWLIWSNLLTKQSWRKEEFEFTKEISRRSNPDSDPAFAYALLSILEGDVHEALQQLDRSLPNGIHFIFHWLDYFSAKKLWKPYLHCLEFLQARIRHVLPMLERSDLAYHFTRNVISYVKQYVNEHKKYDMYEKIMLDLLPHSKFELERYFLERNQYKKWMDLMLLTDGREYVSKDTIKMIQKESPETLLPLFHREVADAVERKNRQSYKQAVRALKKLRTIYKKIKREKTWETYFTQLLDETKRLRAFHEECKRAKLIQAEE